MLKNFLLRLRAEGWTQQEIASKSGLSQTLISKLMRGEGNCQLDSALKLAKAFGVTVEEMTDTQARKFGNSIHSEEPKPKHL